MSDYVKFRFVTYDRLQATAGLIMDKDQFRRMSIEDISRRFPYSESMKMQMLEYSEPYGDWNSAFAHTFDIDEDGPPIGPNVKSQSYNVIGLLPPNPW